MSILYKLIKKRSIVDKVVRFYATVVYGKTYNMSQLAKELAAKSTTASEGDTFSVLIGLRDLIKEHLERSERVHIEGIGTFEVVISSEGAENEEDFHPSMIKSAKASYRPDAEMKGFTNGLKKQKYVSKIK